MPDKHDLDLPDRIAIRMLFVAGFAMPIGFIIGFLGYLLAYSIVGLWFGR